MIKIENLTFKYEGAKKNALDKINLQIEDGDFLGIIGESGAGKTTLCSAINALIPHHYKGDFYGSVKIDDKDSFDTTPGQLALKVGSVFQDIDSQLLSTFVEDEILFGLENFDIPKDQIESRVQFALEEVGITDLRYREIASLSGGQKQKVAIAAIIALQPKILVLDEPTGELDPASSRQIFALLDKLNKEKGITIIVIEQKIMLLCEFAKKLAVMEKGKITHFGKVREVLKNAEELEEKGINIPRVVTLSRQLINNNLLPENLSEDEEIAINSSEAAELIKKITAGKSNKKAEIAEASDTPIRNQEPLQTDKEKIIQFQKVQFSYHSDANITDIDVNINKGDFLAIIGSNGAGKSTFSKLCNGLLKPTSGNVIVKGNNTKKVKTSHLAKNIGFLFQNPDRQICCNTVKEEIAFSLKNIGLAEEDIKARVEKTIKEFNFDPEKDPFTMSRGQRQRLCLACLIALESDILILDEPTTGLDYKECIELMEKIRNLNKKGTTVIMVCHDMEVVLDYATRILIMTNGKVIADNDAKTILKDKELLLKARLLQPQIAETASKLGPDFDGIFTVEEMIEKIRRLNQKA
jgi:energy-coupling factor transport system ATP-binding protein